MSTPQPPPPPKRRAFARPPTMVRVAPHPNQVNILHAAQNLTQAATAQHLGKRQKRRRTDSGSQIIIIGPFPSQVLDLSSSSESSQLSSPGNESFAGEPGIPSPPTTPATPTRATGTHLPLLDSPPSTDWVEYSAPLSADEELAVDEMSFCSGFTSFASMSSQAPVHLAPQERAVLIPEDLRPKPSRDDDAFTRMLLQKLQIASAMPMKSRPYVRPQPAFHRHGPPHLTPNRIIPLPFDPVLLYASSSITAPPSVASSARTAASSALTVVSNDSESNPHLCAQQVWAEEALFSESMLACTACDARDTRMFHLRPCDDFVCPACFSSSIAAVSVSKGESKCPACLEKVSSFEQYKPGHIVAVRGPVRHNVARTTDDDKPYEVTGKTIAMRIDNVAWDIEPSIVERFLPFGTLPVGHPQPIHLCISLLDGRTKDYMYIEVTSQAAARRILQTRQNAFMPGGRVTGGRKRAVTITQVTHKELLQEIRPNSNDDLKSLLELCEAALSTPAPQLHMDSSGRGRLHPLVGTNGKVHYLKYRHAPFHVLISLLFKMNGTASPVYWDLFRVASGAISALATVVKNNRGDPHGDRALLVRLNQLFDKCFSTRPGL